jgi:hypothetical protein
MGVTSLDPMPFLDPYALGIGSTCPALGLMRAEAWPPADLVALKQRRGRAVHVVFPVKSGAEAANVARLVAILAPWMGSFIDAVWLACGATEPGDLAHLPQQFNGLRLFMARAQPPLDQVEMAWGKGAVMRAMLHHLLVSRMVTDRLDIVQFLDADIKPDYFSPAWCLGPVGALLWFQGLAACKVVYFRPRGGRLNTFIRSLLATLPHPGVQRLQALLYLLSGEMAATLAFWSAVPFKTGYGVELFILLQLALEQLRLEPGRSDLASLAQVYVGQMDHRHAPLRSDGRRAGLDQMAAALCQTLWDTLSQTGVLEWTGTPTLPGPLRLPLAGRRGAPTPSWLTVPLVEATLPPLRTLPPFRELCPRSVAEATAEQPLQHG